MTERLTTESLPLGMRNFRAAASLLDGVPVGDWPETRQAMRNLSALLPTRWFREPLEFITAAYDVRRGRYRTKASVTHRIQWHSEVKAKTQKHDSIVHLQTVSTSGDTIDWFDFTPAGRLAPRVLGVRQTSTHIYTLTDSSGLTLPSNPQLLRALVAARKNSK